MKKLLSLLLALAIVISIPGIATRAAQSSELNKIGVDELGFYPKWECTDGWDKFIVDFTTKNKTYYVYQHLAYRLYCYGAGGDKKITVTLVAPDGSQTILKSSDSYFFKQIGSYSLRVKGPKGTISFQIKTKRQPMINYITYGGSKHFIDRTRYHMVKAIGWPQHIYDVKPLERNTSAASYLPKDSSYKVYVYDNGREIMSVLLRDYYIIGIELMSQNPNINGKCCVVPESKKAAPDMHTYKKMGYDKDNHRLPRKLGRNIVEYFDLFSKVDSTNTADEPTTKMYSPKPFGVAMTVYGSGICDLVAGEEYFDETFALMQNKFRSWYGLKPLMTHQGIKKVAYSHSKEMYDYGYYAHEDKDGNFFSERLHRIAEQEQNLSYSFGENIYTQITSPLYAITAFINSIGHRNNILSPNWQYQGCALYEGEKKNFLTIDFAGLR